MCCAGRRGLRCFANGSAAPAAAQKKTARPLLPTGRSFLLSQTLRANQTTRRASELTVWSYFFFVFFVAFLVAFFFAAFFAIVLHPFICACD